MIGCIPNSQNKGLLDFKVDNLRIVSISITTARLAWDAVEVAKYYGINLSDSNDVLLRQYNVSMPAITIDSLEPKTEYIIVVGAYPENGSGSAPSDQFYFTTLP
jgi:hypothetical protein